jgi:hypothetical protein
MGRARLVHCADSGVGNKARIGRRLHLQDEVGGVWGVIPMLRGDEYLEHAGQGRKLAFRVGFYGFYVAWRWHEALSLEWSTSGRTF